MLETDQVHKSIRDIAEHHDEISGVVRRSKRHVHKSAVGGHVKRAEGYQTIFVCRRSPT